MISARETRFSVNTISNRATALGVYDLVYGSAVSTPANVKIALDRMYEPNAGKCTIGVIWDCSIQIAVNSL